VTEWPVPLVGIPIRIPILIFQADYPVARAISTGMVLNLADFWLIWVPYWFHTFVA
jgi:hypothetical protein